ncbi:cysteine ABC transporter substrate-binding protein [Eikenella corrodens]|uniref:ABC transporter substrate-binding protein n=2 Tax=Eikenella corrodens TaxID=539 RepID=A0A1A9RTA9_EIKCO|nr:cysteine ABC transporter substrate-binding protein [Eikenella corrodens]EEG22961.1 ABC transporter, substrate-binding protein, family 3 [Eikenella corrodens ATCC 23834]MDU4301918.1 cysteine ABC transporter substrate-binding protein [Eikenella corrodens]OAM21419.1 ABC transporter substrate-binding protein [Eikenella corrodens]OAM23494.1 ABC transporter substrate-binding protein [Eikenella corrodens]OWP27555.1 ABC transporter substrate-binding protein [Eikenella corrodens]
MQLHQSFKTLLATVVLGFGLAACGGGGSQGSSDQPASGSSAANASAASGAASDDALAKIKERGVIRIGVFGDKPPFGYVDANGKSQGFDVEIAKYLANDLLGSPDKVEFVLTEAANRVEYVRSGKVDLILANFTQTPERAEVVDFASPYMNVALGVVSPKGAPITDLSQLEGKTLLVNKGTTADAYFTKNHPNINLLKFDQNTETFDALKDGRGVALAHDNALLWAWAKENPNFEVVIGNIGPAEHIAPAVRKGDQSLLNWVNQEIAAIKQDGRLHAAYEKTLRPVYGDKEAEILTK